MQEGLLDGRIWRELVEDCGLDPARRPQVRFTCKQRHFMRDSGCLLYLPMPYGPTTCLVRHKLCRTHLAHMLERAKVTVTML